MSVTPSYRQGTALSSLLRPAVTFDVVFGQRVTGLAHFVALVAAQQAQMGSVDFQEEAHVKAGSRARCTVAAGRFLFDHRDRANLWSRQRNAPVEPALRRGAVRSALSRLN